ncbi:MAG: vanadium-dependent haloperoxidase [Sphingobacteriales bacterium]|nr:vanadium-dependent haloperoxidase [Sphingobacteriales bacterium]
MKLNNFKRGLLVALSISFLLLSCSKNTKYEKTFSDPKLFRQTVKKLSDVMVDNIFSPSVASRNYAYSNIAAYEVVAALDSQYISLNGQINDLKEIPLPDKKKKYNLGLSAIIAYCKVAESLTFPEGSFKPYTDSLKNLAKVEGMPDELLNNSVSYGDEVGKAIIDWSKGDNYAQTRSAPKYSVNNEEGRWVPTPPGYIQAVEPSWGKIRTLAIDSGSQFLLARPPAFNMKDKNSEFYKNALEVMNVGKNLTKEQNHIANFWDCNPYAIQMIGHVSIATKKISPGGHWLNIAGIASEISKADFQKTIYSYTFPSIAIFDAFVCAWDEKYRSSVIRPETAINKYITPDWHPLLQTPPFPEYPSAHSVISYAGALALTKIYGDHFSFTDTSELEFGIPSRTFKSFITAANEAGISRLYGGIHYRSGVEEGLVQGKQIGNYIVNKLKMKK